MKHISTLTGIAFSIAGAFTILSAPKWGKKNDSDFRKFGFRGYKRNLIFPLLIF